MPTTQHHREGRWMCHYGYDVGIVIWSEGRGGWCNSIAALCACSHEGMENKRQNNILILQRQYIFILIPVLLMIQKQKQINSSHRTSICNSNIMATDRKCKIQTVFICDSYVEETYFLWRGLAIQFTHILFSKLIMLVLLKMRYTIK